MDAARVLPREGSTAPPGAIREEAHTPEPVRIIDVARRLIAESKKKIEIVFTGLRPGEKLHEALFSTDEAGSLSSHPLISRVAVPPLSPSVVLNSNDAEPESTQGRTRDHSATIHRLERDIA